jgi:alcohol dehydrogenase (cytochrome c)
MLAAVTPTAGGVVFAADMGGTLYALDAGTGRVLWQADSGQSRSPVWLGGSTQSRILGLGLR